MTQAYNKLKELLEELFQFDREDLDFGIYRVMNQKRAEVSTFLDDDLLPQVKQAFAEYRGEEVEGARRELAALAKTLGDAGVSAESSPKYVALREKVEESKDVEALENEVYSGLYTFFRRYYKNGDFLSLRRYKEGVYALPYEGEEVKLHWANADQYYVKTAENFRRYRFAPKDGGSVAFELVVAGTERDSNKAAGGKERRFVLREEEAVEERDGELRVSFEYRPHPDKQADLNRSAVKTILDYAPGEWKVRLSERAPTPSTPDRTLLEKHLDEYTARNTFDYFIHKDLGRFLNRELDFFLKNEVLRVDDLDTGDERRVGQYLSKLRVMKRIGRKIVAFLAHIEDFQKRLFLKKKFVVSSGYCLTLDNVPEDLYPEITANDAQYEEWESLFSIGAIEASLENGGDQRSVEWLKANLFLVLDTKHFDDDFKDRLLAVIKDLDEKTDGLLVESENFQALNLMQTRYRERVKCIYIDPPYNAPASEILYKNNYKHSSWLSLMADRISLGSKLFAEDGSLIAAIDENEQERLGLLLDICLPDRDKTCVSIVQNPRGIQGQNFSYSSEYAYFMFPRDGRFIGARDVPQSQWEYSNLRNWGGESTREHGRNSFYPIYVKNDTIVRLGEVPPENFHAPAQFRRLDNEEYEVWPIDKNGVERKWRYSRKSLNEVLHGTRVVQKHDEIQVQIAQLRERYKTVWVDPRYDAGTYGTRLLGDMLADKFSFPKSLFTVSDCLSAVVGEDDKAIVIDFFAGSGTTGHAVINLNREDGGRRKYVLVEMGEYFGSVLKPRILKAIYSKDWRDGKPVSREGVSHVLKYLSLESYEDTLNNLSLHRTDVQSDLIASNDALREAYTLRYMMDFETQDSPSLLDLDAFEDPFRYTLEVARGDETREETVDLVETFNYLLGLTVRRLYAADGFRVVEGTDPAGDEVLVIWRNTHEKSDGDLAAFFEAQGFAERSFDRVYANGDNTLALKTGDGGPKVYLIEEEFRRLMFEAEGV